MAHERVIDEDLQAILDALRADSALTALVGGNTEHLNVGPGTLPPYVILVDAALEPQNTFGGNVAAEEGYYILRAITIDTASEAAATVASNIHTAITRVLHGKKITVSNGFKTIAFRRGSREMYHWEEISSETRYLHSGFKWLGTFAKAVP